MAYLLSIMLVILNVISNTKHMKALKIALAIVAASTIVSCHMNNELDHPVLSGQVAGTYNGTLRSSLLQTEMSATTEITSINVTTYRPIIT